MLAARAVSTAAALAAMAFGLGGLRQAAPR
jgi:hypothetical protein